MMNSQALDSIDNYQSKEFAITSRRLLMLCRDRSFFTQMEPNSFFEELPMCRIR